MSPLIHQFDKDRKQPPPLWLAFAAVATGILAVLVLLVLLVVKAWVSA